MCSGYFEVRFLPIEDCNNHSKEAEVDHGGYDDVSHDKKCVDDDAIAETSNGG